MTEYEVAPRATEWEVTVPSQDEPYRYRKRGTARSVAKALASEGDTIVIYRFDGERLEEIDYA